MDADLQPRRVPRQARSKALVEALVEATGRLLASEGHAAVTTQRVAELAGVSVGSLYQYFPGRDALVQAVADRHYERMMGLLTEHALRALGRPVPDVVRGYVDGMLAAHSLDPGLDRAIAQHVLGRNLNQLDAVQSRAQQLVLGWLQLNREQVRPRNLEHAAFLLVTTAEAAVHGAQLYAPERLQDPAFTDELVDLLLRYLL